MSTELVDRKAIFRRVIPIAVVGISIAVLISLFFVVTQRMNGLRQASGDNLTWALSQTEVDLLRLVEETTLSQQQNTTTFEGLRRRFDNFHSRVTGIVEGPVFAPMRADPAFMDQLNKLIKCLEFTTPLIDKPDDDLRENLDFILLGLNGIRSDVHDIALTGIKLHSEASDEERSSFSKLLLFAAVVSIALIFFLILMLIFMLRQYRLQRHTAAEVERANSRLESTFQVSLDAIIVADDHGNILDFNRSAEAVFGFSREEAIGAQMAELIIPHQYRDAHHAGMERFNKTQEPRLVGQGRIEITALRKSGVEFPVEISTGQAQDHRGAIFISYLRDITERLAAEADLKQARDDALQAEKAKSNFLAVMSHEMRTPLNGLFGTMELLQKTKLTKKQTSYVEVAQRSGKILLHHVNDVLDVSRMDAGKMELTKETFDLKHFFQDVITTNEATAFAKGNTLLLNLKRLPKRLIITDEHRLRQVAFNLVSNALKFTNQGTVTVTVDVDFDSEENGPTILQFSITDTGVGISTEDQDRVFERFFTQEKSYDRLAPGAGLGLTICKQIIDMMGGAISLRSALGTGTTFQVTVPVKLSEDKELPVEKAQKPIDGSTLKGHRILLVEDNKINCMIVNEMLQSEGLIVEEAHNGQQAIDMTATKAYSAILMDISMPVMNGVDAARAIRTSDNPNSETPILALTAHALADEQARFFEAGMNSCLDKPVSQNMLIRALVDSISDQAAQLKQDHQPLQALLIDVEIFEELQSVLTGKKLNKLLDGFESEIQYLLSVFPDHLNQDGLDALAIVSHKSVGSAGMIGAMSLRDDLRLLEQAAKTGNLEEAEAAAIGVTENWPQTRKALRAAR